MGQRFWHFLWVAANSTSLRSSVGFLALTLLRKPPALCRLRRHTDVALVNRLQLTFLWLQEKVAQTRAVDARATLSVFVFLCSDSLQSKHTGITHTPLSSLLCLSHCCSVALPLSHLSAALCLQSLQDFCWVVFGDLAELLGFQQEEMQLKENVALQYE